MTKPATATAYMVVEDFKTNTLVVHMKDDGTGRTITKTRKLFGTEMGSLGSWPVHRREKESDDVPGARRLLF